MELSPQRAAFAEIGRMEINDHKLVTGFKFTAATHKYFYDYKKPSKPSNKRKASVLQTPPDSSNGAMCWATAFSGNPVVRLWCAKAAQTFCEQRGSAALSEATLIAKSKVVHGSNGQNNAGLPDAFFSSQLEFIARAFKSKLRNRAQASVCRQKKTRRVDDATASKQLYAAHANAAKAIYAADAAHAKNVALQNARTRWGVYGVA
jgi:hypothetical protein